MVFLLEYSFMILKSTELNNNYICTWFWTKSSGTWLNYWRCSPTAQWSVSAGTAPHCLAIECSSRCRWYKPCSTMHHLELGYAFWCTPTFYPAQWPRTKIPPGRNCCRRSAWAGTLSSSTKPPNPTHSWHPTVSPPTPTPNWRRSDSARFWAHWRTAPHRTRIHYTYHYQPLSWT